MTDVELVQLIRHNDPKGLAVLYEIHRAEFINWVLKFANCGEEDAAEYYQASILIVYDNIQAGRLNDPKSSFKTYLFSIAKNLILENHRQKDRDVKVTAEYCLQLHLGGISNEEERKMELIGKCFQELGDPCYALLDLFYYHKKSMEEIALELGYKNVDTAKNQKFKCMERLRNLVEAAEKKKKVASRRIITPKYHKS